jgi:hypothetical protein
MIPLTLTLGVFDDSEYWPGGTVPFVPHMLAPPGSDHDVPLPRTPDGFLPHTAVPDDIGTTPRSGPVLVLVSTSNALSNASLHRFGQHHR